MEIKSWVAATGAEPGYRRINQGGSYTVQVELNGAGRYPLKGGQGDYEPRGALLVWTTADGGSWEFLHAILTGPQVNPRTGQFYPFNSSQTIYLGDPGYPASEPAWLAALVRQTAPTTTTAAAVGS